MIRFFFAFYRKSTAWLTLVALCLSFWVFPPSSVHAGWYQTVGWDYRMRLTVESAHVDAALTDFPVYLDLSQIDEHHGFWRGVKSDGSDIRITTSDGETEVPVEIVDIDTSTASGEIHFKANSLSDTDDTQFWLYYGNGSATMPADTHSYGKENVWNSDYEMVHHLTGASETDLDDSTANDHDMTTDVGAPVYDSVGQIGEGVEYDGSDDLTKRVESNFLNSQESGSFSLWAKHGTGSDGYLFTVSDESVLTSFFTIGNFDTGYMSLYVNGGAVNIMKATTYTGDGNWHHFVFTSNGSTTKIYIDGSEETVIERNGTNTGQWFGDISNTDNITLGALIRSDATYEGAGTVDEVKVMTSVVTSTWISTEYNNQNAPESFITFGEQEVAAEKTWYDVDWSHRTKITIDHTLVEDDLNDFPVYLNLADLGVSHAFWGTVEADGKDIRITQVDGHREVPVELVSIDTSGKTGEVYFKTDLSDTSDSVFWIYYGNSGATMPTASSDYGSEKVWDGTYVMVQHMTGAAYTDLDDSTTPPHDITIEGTGGSAPTYNQTGKLGESVYYPGTDRRAEIADSTDFNTQAVTVSAWINISDFSVSNFHRGLVDYSYPDGSASGYSLSYVGSNKFRFSVFDGADATDYTVTTASGWSIDTWYHLVGVHDPDTDEVQLYVNGTPETPLSHTTGIGYNDYPSSMEWKIGASYDNSTDRGLDGFADSVRISNVARSEDWITTEFNNQNSSSTFFKTLHTTTAEALADTAWYNDGGTWTNRLAITIQDNAVSVDLNDFPVYLDLSQIPSSHTFWTGVKSGGEDIRITLADGVSEVPVEIVDIDTSGKTGEVYFKLPQLTATQETTVYVYYGNSSATEPAAGDAAGRNSVWSEYVFVHHLQGANRASLIDSTGNGHVFSSEGGSSVYESSGKLSSGDGIDFNGSDNYIAITDHDDLSPWGALNSQDAQLSFSVWAKPDDAISAQYLVTKGGSDNWEYGIYVQNEDLVSIAWQSGGGDHIVDQPNNDNLTQGAWQLYYFTLDYRTELSSTLGTLRSYVDSTASFSDSPDLGGMTNGTADLELGARGSGGYYFDGTLDEFRLTQQLRTSDWVSTEYNNQNFPETFFTVNIAEGDPPLPGPGKRKAFMISKDQPRDTSRAHNKFFDL